MRAAVRAIVQIARKNLAGLIGVRTFDYENQFVPDVFVTRQLSRTVFYAIALKDWAMPPRTDEIAGPTLLRSPMRIAAARP